GIRPDKATLEAENVKATVTGARTNLDRHIRNMAAFGIPVVVSINKFASDTDAEISAIRDAAHESGATSVCITEVHANGGEGGKDLAQAVVKAVQNHIASGRPFVPLFEPEVDVLEKATAIATRMYKANGISMTAKAKRELDRIRSWGYGNLPVCMAKTQYSFSHDASLLGAPTGFTIPIGEFRLNAGAGFIVAVLGNMMTMPGLPKRPAALDMDMDENGNLLGVFG
ncbi:MAG: formate--tetrahydrofolate ligase, partial [Euryarchaeota archaeon]|nr:formate--tetrahydrofolate ligase [Euryarchaeota archaeon]